MTGRQHVGKEGTERGTMKVLSKKMAFEQGSG